MKQFLQAILAKAAGFQWNPEGKIWGRKAVATGSLGAAGAMTALGQIFGISAVIHSSGGLILTGSAGYISGTFLASFVAIFAWVVWPLLVVIGLVALFWGKIRVYLGRLNVRISKGDDAK